MRIPGPWEAAEFLQTFGVSKAIAALESLGPDWQAQAGGGEGVPAGLF